MKYFLHLAYKGTNYRGWQRQVNVVSVQQTIEETLSQVLKHEVVVLGCGRTDAEVHASQYFLQFESNTRLDNSFCFVLNKVLPEAIRVYHLLEVDANANVQLDAVKRTYRYYAHARPSPFLADLSAYYSCDGFDAETVNTALRLLPAQNDYRAFCKTPDRHNHTLVNVENAKAFVAQQNQMLCIEISANRFLKGMMRALVHDLLLIATAKLTIDAFEERLTKADAVSNIQLAYSQGLYLAGVEYPYVEVESRLEPMAALFGTEQQL